MNIFVCWNHEALHGFVQGKSLRNASPKSGTASSHFHPGGISPSCHSKTRGELTTFEHVEYEYLTPQHLEPLPNDVSGSREASRHFPPVSHQSRGLDYASGSYDRRGPGMSSRRCIWLLDSLSFMDISGNILEITLRRILWTNLERRWKVLRDHHVEASVANSAGIFCWWYKVSFSVVTGNNSLNLAYPGSGISSREWM